MTSPDGGGTLMRSALATFVSGGLTGLSLVLVATLTGRSPLLEAPADAPQIRIIASPPEPPPPPEPLTNVAAEPAVAPSVRRESEHIEPPAPAPPAVAGVDAGAIQRSMPIGAKGGLPSIASLPSSSLGEVDPPRVPTTPARVTHRPAPSYPPAAQRRGIEGHVKLVLRIDERGRVADAVVVEADPPGVFDQTALRTVRQYRFDPAREGDRPVASSMEQTIRFELER